MNFFYSKILKMVILYIVSIDWSQVVDVGRRMLIKDAADYSGKGKMEEITEYVLSNGYFHLNEKGTIPNAMRLALELILYYARKKPAEFKTLQ